MADTDILGINGNTVQFRVERDYADRNFEDPYQGYVTLMVAPDVA